MFVWNYSRIGLAVIINQQDLALGADFIAHMSVTVDSVTVKVLQLNWKDSSTRANNCLGDCSCSNQQGTVPYICEC